MKSSLLHWLATCAVGLILALGQPTVANADPIDKAKQAALDVERRAAADGNLIQQNFIIGLLNVLDTLNQMTAEQQKQFFAGIGMQQETFFASLQLTLDQMNQNVDEKLDRADVMLTTFEHSMENVTRASKEPFIATYSPRYLIESDSPICITVKGASLANGAGTLRVGGQEAKQLEKTESELTFLLPKDSIVFDKKSIVPVSMDLQLVSDTSFFFFRHPLPYKLVGYALPARIGDVRIIAERNYNDTEEWTGISSKVFDKTDSSAVDPDDGYVLPSDFGLGGDWEFVEGNAVHFDERTHQYVDGAGGRGSYVNSYRMSDNRTKLWFKYGAGGTGINLSAHVGFVVRATLRRKVAKFDSKQLYPDTETKVQSPADLKGTLTWEVPIDVRIPAPYDMQHIYVYITYFDKQEKIYNSSGRGRYVEIRIRNDHVTVTPDLRTTFRTSTCDFRAAD